MKLELTEDEVEFLHEYLFTEYESILNTYGQETKRSTICYDLSQEIFEQLCKFRKQSYEKPTIYHKDIKEFENLLSKTLKAFGDGHTRKCHEFGNNLINSYQSKLDEIECLTHNIEVYKEREQIGIRRLEKVVRYLKIQELTDEQINHILQLEEENF